MVQKHATSGTQEKGEGKGNSQIYIDLQRVMLVKERKRHRGGGRGDRGGDSNEDHGARMQVQPEGICQPRVRGGGGDNGVVEGGAALDQGCDGQSSDDQHIKPNPKTQDPYPCWSLHLWQAA